jgi:hypothetical protein
MRLFPTSRVQRSDDQGGNDTYERHRGERVIEVGERDGAIIAEERHDERNAQATAEVPDRVEDGVHLTEGGWADTSQGRSVQR